MFLQEQERELTLQVVPGVVAKHRADVVAFPAARIASTKTSSIAESGPFVLQPAVAKLQRRRLPFAGQTFALEQLQIPSEPGSIKARTVQ